MVEVKLEEKASLQVMNGEVLISFKVNGNIRLVNQKYNKVPVNSKNAVAIEWQIRGEEAIRVFLAQLAPRFSGNLFEELKNKLRLEITKLKQEAEILKNSGEKIQVVNRINQVEIVIKRGGRYQKHYPTVNIVIPISECKYGGKKYRWSLTFDKTIELVYKAIFWISVSELSVSKGLDTIGVIFGKSFQRELEEKPPLTF
jgi:hypothetical protein